MADWLMKGEYLKACSCDAGCPCDFWAPPTRHYCEGAIAMRVTDGHFEKTPLTGLIWAAVFHWPGPLHEGNGTLQPYISDNASDAQRNALLTMMSGKAGGPWFEVVTSLISKVHPPRFAPIQWQFDLKKREGKWSVPGEIEIVAEPIRDPNGNQVPARIQLPNGIEYFETEVAIAKVMKSTGQIKFDSKGTHSSFSEVTHTPTGLKH